MPAAAAAASDDASTRHRVARSILQHGPSTASDLAERLRLTPAAVRRHLSALEEAGHLTTREQRVYGLRGRGRPAKVYVLTDAGRASFDASYDEVAIAALDYVRDRLGPGAVGDFAAREFAVVEQAFAASDIVDPAERLAEAFNASGYVVSLLPAASGRQLCHFHCPIAAVARAHPELCHAETRLIARLLGTHVQRLATIAAGDEVCCTHLPRPRTDDPTQQTPTERKAS